MTRARTHSRAICRGRDQNPLGAARAINTAESQFAAKNSRKYGQREDLVPFLDAARRHGVLAVVTVVLVLLAALNAGG